MMLRVFSYIVIAAAIAIVISTPAMYIVAA